MYKHHFLENISYYILFFMIKKHGMLLKMHSLAIVFKDRALYGNRQDLTSIKPSSISSKATKVNSWEGLMNVDYLPIIVLCYAKHHCAF
jgi:hypothetical protein